MPPTEPAAQPASAPTATTADTGGGAAVPPKGGGTAPSGAQPGSGSLAPAGGKGSPPTSGAPAGGAPAAGDGAAKPGTKEWDAALKAEKAARKARQDAKAGVQKAQEEAAARVREAEAKAAQVQPFLDAIEKGDVEALLKLAGKDMQYVVDKIADAGRDPTPQEIAANAAKLAREEIEKKLADEREAEKKKLEADDAAKKAEEDKRYEAIRSKHLGRLAGAIADKANADALAELVVLTDGDEEALGSWCQEALDLTEKKFNATYDPGRRTGEYLTPAEALQHVQNEAIETTLASLAKLVRVPRFLARLQELISKTEPTKPGEKPKNGGAAQPTLSNRNAAGTPVVDLEERDDGPTAVTMEAVRRAARKALPHLRQHFSDDA